MASQQSPQAPEQQSPASNQYKSLPFSSANCRKSEELASKPDDQQAQLQQNYPAEQEQSNQQQFKSLNITLNTHRKASNSLNGSQSVPRTSASGLVPSSEAAESRTWVSSDAYTPLPSNSAHKSTTLPLPVKKTSASSQDSAVSLESGDSSKLKDNPMNSPAEREGPHDIGKRPHSIDAEFVQKLEQMGLSQSLPYVTAGGNNTLPIIYSQRL